MEHLSRRRFLFSASAAVAAARISQAAQEIVPTLLDHILLGCPNLEDGIAFVEERLGVRAAFGGVHPGVGTQNALLSLGERRYLEIIAPDPNQPRAEDARELKTLKGPKIIGWAAHPGNLDDFALTLRTAGIEAAGPKPGSRKRPDGQVLHWKTLILQNDAGGLLPFFIEWGEDTTHPSVDAPQGCKLTTFEAATPDHAGLEVRVRQMDLDLFVLGSNTPHLVAEIVGPNGKHSSF
jgi:catechol 2,3-dioxygenase-like lactoylglutathione lyase family enzyme